MSDMTSAAAIDLLDNLIGMVDDNQGNDYDSALHMAIDALKAQAERTEERTETHACDLISRQAAIRWVKTECNPYGKPTLDFESGKKVIEHLKQMPSAQPESCVDTIDALNESIKHFDDMAEECRRNANIERNDYMDMRDDAAEYRQLSIWLNELKWLRERFQSQPDMSGYSDKLWKAAYERGKAEAQQRWIPCSERLPEGKQEVLVTEYGDTDMGRRFDGRWVDRYGDKMKDVTAWMPLPEPYREEGD